MGRHERDERTVTGHYTKTDRIVMPIEAVVEASEHFVAAQLLLWGGTRLAYPFYTRGQYQGHGEFVWTVLVEPHPGDLLLEIESPLPASLETARWTGWEVIAVRRDGDAPLIDLIPVYPVHRWRLRLVPWERLGSTQYMGNAPIAAPRTPKLERAAAR